MSAAGEAPLRIGISACLLGQQVRWDGSHKRDAAILAAFGATVEWVGVCPEAEVGMGTPREPVRLERDGERARLIAPGSGRDWTATMHAWAERRIAALAAEGVCGFVLKKDSPSCGLEQVKVFVTGAGVEAGRGVFAALLLARLPDLPVADEDRLHDPAARAAFLARARAYRRERSLRPR